MEFTDHYATLGVARTATQDDIKLAYRKLARKYHPDVSKEPDAEARFKKVAQAYEALGDAERRAAHDEIARRRERGQKFGAPPGWDGGFEFNQRGAGTGREPDYSDFFEAAFGQDKREARRQRRRAARTSAREQPVKVLIDLEEAYRGARRTLNLQVPVVDAKGHVSLQDRQLDVNIPKGVREGQQLRLAGQGGSDGSGDPATDLYLEIAFRPHRLFRVEGLDVYLDLPIAPWEAALGATVNAPTPDGSVQLSIPAGSSSGRKLRLKGKGLPSPAPGDLYAVLTIVLPAIDAQAAKDAYGALARQFPDFNPRDSLTP